MSIQKVSSTIVICFLLLQNLIPVLYANVESPSNIIENEEEIVEEVIVEEEIVEEVVVEEEIVEEVIVEEEIVEEVIVEEEIVEEVIVEEVIVEEVIVEEVIVEEEGISVGKKDLPVLSKDSDTPSFSHERVIIKYKDGTSNTGKARVKSRMQNMQSKSIEIESLDELNIGLLTFDNKNIDSQEIQETINNLNKLPYVEYAEPDYIVSIQDLTGVVTNDPRSDELWHLKSINADLAWKLYNDDENKTLVSVSDTGVDYTHPDLIEHLKDISSECYSSTGALISGGCPNHGRNFESSSFPILGENDTYDISGHGTHISGIIGAVRDNNIGISGVTKNTDIIAARVDTYDSLYQLFYISDTIKALDFAIQNNVKVVNASYGGPFFSQASYDSILRARNNGILVVAAAGNSGTDNDVIALYPSSYDLDNIISVASIGPNDTLASYSNYGKNSVDILAPGGEIINSETGEGGILSTYPGQEIVWEENFDTSSQFIISGSGSNWYLFDEGRGIYTQSSTTYTGSVDSTLTFNPSFSLQGATVGILQGNISCDFGTTGIFDSDFGDALDFYIYDQDSGIDTTIASAFSNYVGNGTFKFKAPIRPSFLMKDNLQLKIRFSTDDDDDVGEGCWIDNLSISAHSKNTGSYKYSQGTSMAAPMVSGLISMLWSYKPDLDYQEIKDILFTSIDAIGLTETSITGGKINAEKAIMELISRYGISKTGSFGDEQVNVQSIHLESGKTISLSGTTLNMTGSGNIIRMQGDSVVTGSGNIILPFDSSISYGTGVLLSNTIGDIWLNDENNTPLSQSGQTVYGEGFYISFSGSISGTGTQIKLGEIYDGPLTQGLYIPLSESFSGSLNVQIYKESSFNPMISSDITFILSESTLPYTHFVYAKKHFQVTPINENIEVSQDYNFSVKAVDLDGSTMSTFTGGIIFSSPQAGVIFTGALSDSSYIFQESDNGIKTFTGAVSFTQSGSYNIDITEVGTGTILGNQTINVLPVSIPKGLITTSQQDITNNTGAILTLSSSEYPVSYILTGSIMNSYSGTLNNPEDLSVIFTSGDGSKDIELQLSDLDGNTSNITKGITVDSIAPELTIDSHSPNQYIQGAKLNMSGSIIEINGISSVSLQGNNVSSSGGTWSGEATLSGGLNSIPYNISDLAGNFSSGSIDIIRIPKISSPTFIAGENNIILNFNSDILSQGIILYGTESDSLNLQKNFSQSTNHSVPIVGLNENTSYYYTIQANGENYDGMISPVQSFSTLSRPSGGGGGGAGSSRSSSRKSTSQDCTNTNNICISKNIGTSSISTTAIKLHKKYKNDFYGIKNTMQDEEVNKLYNLYILSWETLSTNYKIKTLQQKEKDVEQFMKVHALMKQKQLSYTMLGSEAQNSPVEKKQDNKIITLQVLLYTRIRKNNGDAQDYNDVRIFLENVYILREGQITEKETKRLINTIKLQYKALSVKI